MIILLFFILTCFAVLTIFLYYAVKSYKSVFELTHPVKYKYDMNSKVPFTYKKFKFETIDGIKLTGIDYRPKTVCRGTVLVCHFLGGSKEAILMFVDSLIMNGYRVLSFDNRNHGESNSDKRIKASLQTDFIAFYEKIKSMGIEGPFGIIGFSMGASQALWAMNKYSDIQAVITDSGPLLYVKKYFCYVLDNKKITNPIVRTMFLFIFLHYVGFSKMAKETIKLLKKLKGKPILMIYGEKDNIISIDNIKLACELLKLNEISVWGVPRSRHLTNKHLKPREYEERIVEFFHKNITVKSNYEKDSVNLS